MDIPRRRVTPAEAAPLWAEAVRLDRLARRSVAHSGRFGPLRDQLYADLAQAGYPLPEGES